MYLNTLVLVVINKLCSEVMSGISEVTQVLESLFMYIPCLKVYTCIFLASVYTQGIHIYIFT